jgi:molybdate transport repressor ModE-like protein
VKLDNGPDWDDVRVFLAIARSGQILSAARRLGIDHATASRHLTALEEGLGARLVERRTSGCRLTPAGEHLKIVAERVESELLHVQSELIYSGLTLSGTITLSVPECFGYYFLASEVGGLIERYPDLNIRLVSPPQLVSLSKREADLAITFGRPTEGPFSARRLVDFAYGVYASYTYLETLGPIRTPSDGRGRTLIVGARDGALRTEDAEKALAQHAGRTMECGSLVGQVRAIEAGIGFGILPRYVADRSTTLVPVMPETGYRQSYWLVSHLDVRDMRRIKEVQRFIVARVKARSAVFQGGLVHD